MEAKGWAAGGWVVGDWSGEKENGNEEGCGSECDGSHTESLKWTDVSFPRDLLSLCPNVPWATTDDSTRRAAGCRLQTGFRDF